MVRIFGSVKRQLGAVKGAHNALMLVCKHSPDSALRNDLLVVSGFLKNHHDMVSAVDQFEALGSEPSKRVEKANFQKAEHYLMSTIQRAYKMESCAKAKVTSGENETADAGITAEEMAKAKDLVAKAEALISNQKDYAVASANSQIQGFSKLRDTIGPCWYEKVEDACVFWF